MTEPLGQLKSGVGERGASAVEYGLLIAAIAFVIIAIVFVIGNMVNGAFTKTCSSINSNGVNTSTSACT